MMPGASIYLRGIESLSIKLFDIPFVKWNKECRKRASVPIRQILTSRVGLFLQVHPVKSCTMQADIQSVLHTHQVKKMHFFRFLSFIFAPRLVRAPFRFGKTISREKKIRKLHENFSSLCRASNSKSKIETIILCYTARACNQKKQRSKF